MAEELEELDVDVELEIELTELCVTTVLALEEEAVLDTEEEDDEDWLDVDSLED
jgi:hypothetical protein